MTNYLNRGLEETCGKTPNPDLRGHVGVYINQDMDRMIRIRIRDALMNDQRRNPLHQRHTVDGEPYLPPAPPRPLQGILGGPQGIVMGFNGGWVDLATDLQKENKRLYMEEMTNPDFVIKRRGK